jgi:cytochrome c553
MKVTVITAIIMAISVSSTLAAEVLRLPAAEGEVKFPHKTHQGIFEDCINCHEKGPGKIDNLGKEWAHTTCKGCHLELKKGPVECTGCHKV